MANKLCTECRGVGVVMVGEGKGRVAELCDCHKDDHRRRLALKCGLEARQLESRLADFKPAWGPGRERLGQLGAAIIDNIANGPKRATLALDKPFIFLRGPNGRGKTFYCECLANELAAMAGLDSSVERLAYFTTEARLYAQLKAAIDDPELGYPEYVVDEAARYGVVIIDEAGVKGSPWYQNLFYRLFEARYYNRAPLILTSNFGIREWVTSYFDDHGPRIADRFVELGVEIKLEGDSWRRGAGARGGESDVE